MRKLFSQVSTALFLISLPALSFAATCTPNAATGLQCPLDETTFSGPEFITNLINKVSNWLFTFLLVLAVTFIVIAAYKYLFSGGSEESVSAAHKMMLYAAVAVAVALLSRGFVVVVRSLVGASTSPSATNGPTTPTSPSPAESPAAQGPIGYRIFDDFGVDVTPAMLPATSISIYRCTLPNGIRWTPAYKFIGVPNVTKLQGGCDNCAIDGPHEVRYGGMQSYQVTGGPEISMEKCADGSSPRFIYNGESFGGTP